MRIAIDGPAASGKGTIAKGIADHFNLPHLDTGLLYRAVGAAVKGVPEDKFEFSAISAAQVLDPTNLDEEELGRPDIAILASRVAQFVPVRAALNDFQVRFAHQAGGAVVDGRDIGTNICPDADVKLYITASPEARASRRTAQLRARGQMVLIEEMLEQINQRDKNDKENPAGAFFMAKDAHLLDTTELDIEASLQAAIAIVNRAGAEI